MTTTPQPHHDNPFRGTSHQTPGAYPFTLDAAPVPAAFVPGPPVTFDPSQWAIRSVTAEGRHPSDPADTVFVFGLNGFGKSVLPAELLDRVRGTIADGDAPIDLDVLDSTDSDGDTGTGGQVSQ